MSKLIDRLNKAAAGYHGTDMGGLLQWAALHIAGQDDALTELREELANEERARLAIEVSTHSAKQAIEDALTAINAPLCPPVEFARDYAPHINVMAHHGDPDYRKRSGLATGHTDTRSTRNTKAATKP